MKYTKATIVTFVTFLIAVSIHAQQPAVSAAKTQEAVRLSSGADTIQYSLGAFVGQWMAKNSFTITNPLLFKRGMDDVLQRKPLAVTDSTIVPIVSAYQLSTQSARSRALEEQLFTALKGTLIPVQRVPVERINRITRKNHQGVVAFISSVTYQKTEDLVPFLFEEGKNPFFVMLDGITDVRNFGAIARTCECAGVDAVIIPAKGSVTVNADAMKTSAGALHTLPVCREQNLKTTLQYLKDSGFRIVAATEKGDYDYTKADYTGPMCIIMGAEDTGVSYDNLALCDEWVKIPMLGSIESLNVSVAAGILIYEGVKQRTN